MKIPTSLWVIGLVGALCGGLFALEARSTGGQGQAAEVAAVRPDSGSTPVAPGTTVADLKKRRAQERAAFGEKIAAAEDAGSGPSKALIMFGLLGAGALGLWLTRRKGVVLGRREPEIKVRSITRVAGRWQIALVEVPGRTLVVGATDRGLSLLTVLESEHDAAGLFEPADLVMSEQPAAPPMRRGAQRPRTMPLAVSDEPALPGSMEAMVDAPLGAATESALVSQSTFLGRLLDELGDGNSAADGAGRSSARAKSVPAAGSGYGPSHGPDEARNLSRRLARYKEQAAG